MIKLTLLNGERFYTNPNDIIHIWEQSNGCTIETAIHKHGEAIHVEESVDEVLTKIAISKHTLINVNTNKHIISEIVETMKL